MQIIVALLTGIVFGAGILISGMANPAKVQNFFDLAGHWDPSLAFVMMGALAVTAVGYLLVTRRSRPLLADQFHIPKNTTIDRPLILGSITFGVGWGIAGFCPGAVFPAVGTGSSETLVFCISMLAGMIIARWLRHVSQSTDSVRTPSSLPTS